MTPISKILCLTLCGLLILPLTKSLAQMSDYPILPVDLTEVSLTEGFWRDRLNTVSDVTIPYAFQKCEENGRINNFIYAGGLKEGKFEGDFGFDDSDVYKIMDSQSPMKATYKKDLLNGVTVLQGKGWVESSNKKLNVQLIPYYAWSHRDISSMSVWLLHDE